MCFIKYFRKPTYMSTNMVPQNSANFPAMTFCPLPQGYKPEVLEANGINGSLAYNSHHYGGQMNWTSNNFAKTASNLFLEATKTKEDIFRLVYIRTIKASEVAKVLFLVNMNVIVFFQDYPNFSAEIKDNFDSDPSFKEKRHRKFGRCYTFFPKKELRQLGIYYIRTEL